MGVYSVLGLEPRASLMLGKHCQISYITSFNFVNIYLFGWVCTPPQHAFGDQEDSLGELVLSSHQVGSGY